MNFFSLFLDDTHFFWDDLKRATDGSALLSRIPYAEHSLNGHEISIFFTMQSLFINVYEVILLQVN